jgi:hypothetical protein
MADRDFSENEHAWVEERLSAYVDNQLAALERAQLERHLRDCGRCQASLASLRWTVSLVKQAPVPALPRTFTLPMPAPTARAPSWGFGFARLATVVATLLLFLVIGVDAISHLGGLTGAPAALQSAAQPTSVALAPQVQDQAKQASPTTTRGTLFAAPQPTETSPEARAPVPAALPPAPPSAPTTAPAVSSGLGGGPEAAETASPPGSKAAASPLPRAPAVAPRAAVTGTTVPAAGAAIVATPVPSSPTATVVVPSSTATVAVPVATATLRPSPTPNAQAYAAPTLAPLPPRQSETPQPIASPLRWTEIGLLFLVVFLATVTVLSRRK